MPCKLLLLQTEHQFVSKLKYWTINEFLAFAHSLPARCFVCLLYWFVYRQSAERSVGLALARLSLSLVCNNALLEGNEDLFHAKVGRPLADALECAEVDVALAVHAWQVNLTNEFDLTSDIWVVCWANDLD